MGPFHGGGEHHYIFLPRFFLLPNNQHLNNLAQDVRATGGGDFVKPSIMHNLECFTVKLFVSVIRVQSILTVFFVLFCFVI